MFANLRAINYILNKVTLKRNIYDLLVFILKIGDDLLVLNIIGHNRYGHNRYGNNSCYIK